ncbi:MAG: hypothetical protein KGH71_00130 [Candidatus Micrarchaeota archaeon]|nr:hypothetical protein [Candidatus Micrarchaeota archaeon]
MNELYILNYLIFSVVAVLFVLEAGIALLSLFRYRHYREEIRKYLLPIWEIDGTFAGLYLVNFEITYPTLLGLVGQMYVAPLLVAGIFFILRSIFLAYSEYTASPDKEELYVKIYSISTIVMVLIAGAVVTSGMSGIGVDVQSSAINLIAIFLNPFNILIMISFFAASVFVVSSVFKVGQIYRYGIAFLAAAFFTVGIAIYAYLPADFATALGNVALPGILLALGIAAAIMQLRGIRFANTLTVLWLFASINGIGIIAYPHIFGNINLAGFIATGAAVGPIMAITIVGGVLVIAALSFLIYLTYKRIEKTVY